MEGAGGRHAIAERLERRRLRGGGGGERSNGDRIDFVTQSNPIRFDSTDGGYGELLVATRRRRG